MSTRRAGAASVAAPGAPPVQEDPRRFPGRREGQLLGKTLRVGGRGEGFLDQHPRGRVVPVPAGALGGEPGDDHVGTELPDHPDQIAEDALLPPDLEGFRGRLGIAEIDGPGEVLLGPVDPAGGQELLRSKETELRPLFRADQVLAALAARDREIGRPVFPALRERGQERGVLVVGMGPDIEDAPENVELLEGDLQVRGVGDAALLGAGPRRGRA